MKACQHPVEHQKELARATEELRHAGLKLTQPRQALLRALIHSGGPVSAEDLHKVLKKSARGPCDLVTVYRGLATLAELGLLNRCDLGDGVLRYEWRALDGHHHHHLICLRCKKVESIDGCIVQGQEKVLAKYGYRNLSHRLEFFGTCPTCEASQS